MIVAGGERIIVYNHYYYYLSFSEPKSPTQSALYEPTIFRKQIDLLLASFLPKYNPDYMW